MPRVLLSIFLVVLPLQVGASSAIRTWVDEDGVVHFSNVGGGERSPARYQKMPGGGVRVVLEGRKARSQPSAKRIARRDTTAYDEILQEASARYNIPVALARAVLAAESNFDPRAISRAGAMGLMQLMPQTAAEMYVSDVFDPRENIFGGVRYLRLLTNLFDGDLVKVIAAYNAGPEAVRRAGGIPNYAETQAYVVRVLNYYREFLERESGEGTNES